MLRTSGRCREDIVAFLQLLLGSMAVEGFAFLCREIEILVSDPMAILGIMMQGTSMCFAGMDCTCHSGVLKMMPDLDRSGWSRQALRDRCTNSGRNRSFNGPI
jgi:hypothetical protein